MVRLMRQPDLTLLELDSTYPTLDEETVLEEFGSVLLTEAQNMEAVVLYPWLMMPMGPVIITVLAFNFVGDGVRDAAHVSVEVLAFCRRHFSISASRSSGHRLGVEQFEISLQRGETGPQVLFHAVLDRFRGPATGLGDRGNGAGLRSLAAGCDDFT